MELDLTRFGNVFATRERARELVSTMAPATPNEDLRLNLDDVFASPSFMAELLVLLTGQFVSIDVFVSSDHLLSLVGSLVEKLGLSGRVRPIGLARAS